MFLIAISFLCGVCILQTVAHLPSLMILLMGILVTFCFSMRFAPLKYVTVILLGAFYADWYAATLIQFQLPTSVEGKPVFVRGIITSLPEKTEFGHRFELSLIELNGVKTSHVNVRLVAPTFYPLQVGDEWVWQVKMKRLRGLQNPGGFDFEAWALQKGIRATGYVLTNHANRVLSHHVYAYAITRFRQYIQQQLTTMPITSPWMSALMIGERNNIPAEAWDVLRKTGTNHLMVIAGLHIGLVGGFVYALTRRIVCLIPQIMLKIPAQEMSVMTATLICFCYALLSGLALPSQRSILMLIPFTLAVLMRRSLSGWQGWSIALMLVLMINPLVVLNESFWLSFATIALILYGMSSRLAPQGWWWHWGRVQWVIGFGLIPLSFSLFQETSVISFIVNTIAIPWLGLIILPLCLLSLILLLLSPFLATYLIAFTTLQINALWAVLVFFSTLPIAAWHVAIPNWLIFFTTIIGVLYLLLPSGIPGKWLGIVWCLPLLTYEPPRPSAGEFWVSVIDVGQGLSVIVETQHHVLLYDTGPGLLNSLNAGENNIIPALRSLSINHLNTIVISHGDNDHLGGLRSILSVIPTQEVMTSVPDKIHFDKIKSCVAGGEWNWDGVSFTMLYPETTQSSRGNDSSCVLKVGNQSNQLLLPGDIEKFSEAFLVKNNRDQLKSSVLIAPHHGSKTSSTDAFINAVNPSIVIFSTGYRNRYHLPHPSIVARYHHHSVRDINTVNSGYVKILFRDTGPIKIDQYRLLHWRYWFDK